MNTDFKVVADILELQAIKKPKDNYVTLVKDKYQGGMFCWNNNSTETPNSGTIFPANDGTVGNWERIIDQVNTFKADWFGAIPNGIVDSTSSIQLALTFISDVLDGGILLLSQGTYKTSQELVVGAKTIIRGAGRNSTVINYIGANSPNLESIFRGENRFLKTGGNPANPNDYRNHFHVGFEDFGIKSPRDAMNALDFTNLSSSWIKSVSISQSGVNSNGIYVNDAENGNGPYYCFVENLNYTGGGIVNNTAIKFNRKLSSPRTANAWTVIGGRIAGCGVGWNMQGNNHTFIGVRCESIQGSCVLLGTENTSSAPGNVILGVGAENVGSFADIQSGARRNTFLPGYITGATDDFVYPATVETNTSIIAGRGLGNKMSNYLEITENQGVRSSVILYSPNGNSYRILVENDGSIITIPA